MNYHLAPMIHLHNGDSVAITARRALVPGRHVAFRETFITGPVRPGLRPNEWIEERARFIAGYYGEHLLRARNEILEQEQMLDAIRDEEEIVLWFEHDLFCLANFLYLLVRLSKARRLSAIWCPHALGTMAEEELVTTYLSRAAVPPLMLRIAAEAWKAYTAHDATALNRFVQQDWPDFPFLRDGMTLHAMRFPSTRNGLGEVEHRALAAIENGASDFSPLFGRFDANPPRYGFGDGEFLRHLRRLASCAVPMITITESGDAMPPKAMFAITPAGRKVLAGEADFIELNNADQWLGGVHLTGEQLWRWDAGARELRPSER
ncbi:MAG TPA: DUF1835 domain-containing protein [Thermoanaerobaculia bacterium]|nr:DUF1835 domain-containing protein [Thermoanaerobaculia bacterium]